MSTSVERDAEQRRYEISVDGEPAGFTAWEQRDGAIAFTHTEVNPAFKGRGVGSQLVGEALDDVRGRGLAVLPFCPFVRSFIASHVDYLDLVPAEQRAAFGLADSVVGEPNQQS
jgi:predicted GNAT family acetyltransferase